MTVEITGQGAARGWIFYDAECCFCIATIRRWGALFTRRGFVWLPLQTPGTAQRLGVTEEQLQAEMWVQTAGGRVVSGVDAWSALMRHVWWLWLPGALIAVPGLRALARVIYRWVARNRRCFGGNCRVRSRPSV